MENHDCQRIEVTLNIEEEVIIFIILRANINLYFESVGLCTNTLRLQLKIFTLYYIKL